MGIQKHSLLREEGICNWGSYFYNMFALISRNTVFVDNQAIMLND